MSASLQLKVKKTGKEVKNEDVHRAERSFGYFSRTLDLPTEVDLEHIEAVYKDGVLKPI